MSEYTVDDLNGYARRLFDEAYEARERRQASREDFFAGWIAALVALHATSMFAPGRWRDG